MEWLLKVTMPKKSLDIINGEYQWVRKRNILLVIGLMVRQHIPINLDNWKYVDNSYKDLIRESKQVRLFLYFIWIH